MTKFNDLNIFTAEQFIESVSEPEASNVYILFGKSDGWQNDAFPPVPNTSGLTFKEIWNNAIGLKKISGFDLSHVINRYKWEANTVYTQYDERDSDLVNKKFYVVNENFDVYKCIFNANGANSIIQPTTISSNNIIQTPDGYLWKYMYSVDGGGQYKFTNNDFIPVKTLTGVDGSNQWQVQQNSVDGAIYAVVVENGGVGYSNTANLGYSVTGDGTGLELLINLDNTTNSVSNVIVTRYGSGYTFADIEVSGGGGSGAVIRPLIGYPGGHGTNPLYELNGSKIMVNVKLNRDEFVTGNEFRQIAIIKDPELWDSNTTASNTIIDQTYNITVTGSGVDFIPDEIVYQGPNLQNATFKGRVVDFNSANGLLKLINTSSIPKNETITGANSAASKFVSSISSPELKKYSGKILYADNIRPIVRNVNQSEDIRLVIDFK